MSMRCGGEAVQAFQTEHRSRDAVRLYCYKDYGVRQDGKIVYSKAGNVLEHQQAVRASTARVNRLQELLAASCCCHLFTGNES